MAAGTVVRVAYLLLVVTSVLSEQQQQEEEGNGCQGYGECGLNGICKVVDSASHCSCPPGFDFVQKNNPSKGCFQKASKQQQKCSGSSGEMENLGHIDWSGNDYQFTTPINQTACKQQCLEDCFCTVVIYAFLEGQGHCWKKTLPLRDGRASITRTAFVKVFKINSP